MSFRVRLRVKAWKSGPVLQRSIVDPAEWARLVEKARQEAARPRFYAPLPYDPNAARCVPVDGWTPKPGVNYGVLCGLPQ